MYSNGSWQTVRLQEQPIGDGWVYSLLQSAYSASYPLSLTISVLLQRSLELCLASPQLAKHHAS